MVKWRGMLEVDGGLEVGWRLEVFGVWVLEMMAFIRGLQGGVAQSVLAVDV